MRAPDNQRRRLMLSEQRLPGRVAVKIGAVVVKEIELNLLIARTVKQKLVGAPGVRRDQLWRGLAMRVLPLSRADG